MRKEAASRGSTGAEEILSRISELQVERALAMLRSVDSLEGTDKDEVERLLENALASR